MGKQGKREFVQVLRLMEVFRANEVSAAVRDVNRRPTLARRITLSCLVHLLSAQIRMFIVD